MEEREILTFNSVEEWREWLSKNYERTEGIWLRFFKKTSGKQTFNYDEALEQALCFGWIDTMANKYDDESYIQKFTPRRPKSMWSKTNIANIERLKKKGKMMPSGLKAFEEARADGRLDAAYDSPANMEVPKDFLQKLSKNKNAEEFFKSLNKTNTYAIAWRLQTAKKPETREKRMNAILEMLEKGEKFH